MQWFDAFFKILLRSQDIWGFVWPQNKNSETKKTAAHLRIVKPPITGQTIIKILIISWLTLAEILTVLFIGSKFWQLGFTHGGLYRDLHGLPNVFSWELNIPKLLVIEEVGGANFHGFIFLWAWEDEIFVNFKLGNHKDEWKQECKQT